MQNSLSYKNALVVAACVLLLPAAFLVPIFIPGHVFAQASQTAPYTVLADGTQLAQPARGPSAGIPQVPQVLACVPAVAGVSQCDWRPLAGLATYFGCTGGQSSNSTFFLSAGVTWGGCSLTVLSGSDQYSVPIGILGSMSCYSSAAGGTCTVWKNGAATPITCTIGSPLACGDTAHSVPVAHGDLISIQVTNSNAGTYTAIVTF